MDDKNYKIEERTVKPSEHVVVRGRRLGAGQKYKIKIKKTKPVEGGER